MSIFDIFKKVITNTPTNTQQPESISTSYSTGIVTRSNPSISLHEDLKGLVWFGDGPLKNYINENISKNTFENSGIKITFRMTGDEEPSLIYTKQHIIIPSDFSSIERPPYFPTYSGLTPEQKGVYIRLLQNPYNNSIDIGFVFILYYGLERHLLIGDYENAFKVILKLRDIHTNTSFQSYSANAIILTSLMQNRGEYALEFIKSIDKDYEYNFSNNLFLLCYYSFDIPLSARDIMRMAKTFEFTNQNYIKKYSDIFVRVLKELMIEKYGADTIQISSILSKGDISKLSNQTIPIFANTSIRDKNIPVPMICENFKLKKEFNILLENAHEKVKKEVTELRKKKILENE
jgi:hypothetical protein